MSDGKCLDVGVHRSCSRRLGRLTARAGCAYPEISIPRSAVTLPSSGFLPPLPTVQSCSVHFLPLPMDVSSEAPAEEKEAERRKGDEEKSMYECEARCEM